MEYLEVEEVVEEEEEEGLFKADAVNEENPVVSTSANEHPADARSRRCRSAGSAHCVPAGVPCWPNWDLMDGLSDSD